FLENVKNLVFHDGGRTLAVIVNTLEQAGYRVFCKVLNASHFGAPTSRERVYFVCVRKDIGITNFEFPLPTRNDVILADVLDPDVGDRYDIERDDIVVEFTPPPHERYPKPVQIGQIGKGGQGYRIYSPQGHAVTFAAQTGGAAGKTGAYLIEGEVRSLSPAECLRVMGFPSDYRIPRSDATAYRLIGNSVAIPVVKSIFEA